MVLGLGDELSVRISAQTGDFERSISSAQRSLTGVVDNALQASGALQFLAGRADNAGDEISETGRKASVTSGLLGGLSLSTQGASISFLGLSGTTLAALVPALVALSTTLVPLTATLTGVASAGIAVAGAFGAVVGSGILAFGNERAKQNQKELAQINAKIKNLEILRETEDGLTRSQQDQLESLEEQQEKLEETSTITGALGEAFGELRDELIPIVDDFGEQFIPLIEDGIAALPRLVRSIFNAVGDLTMFSDALRQLGGAAQRDLPSLIARLTDLARSALPQVIGVGQWLIENGPRIFEGILRTTREVGPLLSQVGSAFGDALPSINRFGTVLLQKIVPALSDGIRGFGNLLLSILDFAQSKEGQQIFDQIRNSISELLPEVKMLINDLGPFFDNLIEEAPKIISGLTGIADTILDIAIFAGKYLVPIFNKALDILGKIGEGFGTLADSAGEVDFIREEFFEGQSQGQITQGNNMSPRGQAQPIQIEVVGDTDVVKQVTAEAIAEREARTTRNTGGNTLP